MIRSIYRRLVPPAVRSVIWRARQLLRIGMRRARHLVGRLRINGGRRPLRKPASHSDQTWCIETSNQNALRSRWVRKNARGTVLDVGCGHGYVTCDVARKAKAVHAIDASPGFLARAVDLAELNGVTNVTFSVGNAYELPFEQDSFDTVTLLEILEHLDCPGRAVSEAIRVARQRVIVTVPAHGHMTELDGHIQDFAPEELASLFPGPVRVTVREPFTLLLYELNP